jgi:hypothetical protein
MRGHLVLSRVHRWVAALVGLQILIWFASGTVMAFLPIEKVRGEHLLRAAAPAPLPPAALARLPDRIAKLPDGPVQVQSYMLGTLPVLRAEFAGGRPSLLLNVTTGAQLNPVSPAMALTLLRARTSVDLSQATTHWVTAKTNDYRGALPAWRIDARDAESAQFYVSAETGEIKTVRTGLWRVYDFLWGLHIMDWKNHESFNTPWMIGFAGLAFCLAVAGFGLLYFRSLRPWLRTRLRRRKKTISP